MPYKTGTRSTMIGVTARTSGPFSYSGPLIPAGVAGTAPDLDPFFQGAFGQPAASGVYTFLDSGFIPVAMFRYNTSGGVNPTNWYAGGGIVQRLTINLSGEFLTITAEGKCVVIGTRPSLPATPGTTRSPHSA
jgi:hypothetical protein